MARKFFYVCAGMFLLAAPHIATGQAVTLYTVSYLPGFTTYTLGTVGAFQDAQDPAALLFGHLPIPGVPVTEIAVEQRVLHPGDVVPLPRYADGTEANESDVFWTVHLWQAMFRNPQGGSAVFQDYYAATDLHRGDRILVSFSGRTYGGGSGRIGPFDPAIIPINVDVMVTVIATRTTGPTPTKVTSWGQVKARYRPTPGMTVTPGADNK